MTTTINISDEEQSADQPPNETGVGGEQSDKTKSEQPTRAGREQPEGAREESRTDATGGAGNGNEQPYQQPE